MTTTTSCSVGGVAVSALRPWAFGGYVQFMKSISARTAVRVTLLALAITLALHAGVARAHVPGLEQGPDGVPMTIGGPEVSRAVYGYLASDDAYDAYVFTVDEPVTQGIGVIVPVRDEHAEFRPALRLLADGSHVAQIADPGLAEREAEWEPFSLTSFWSGAEQEITFEPDVEYELRVEPGTGDAAWGRYVVVFGGPEAFTAADSLRTLFYLPVIWFGAYGGAPPHWNWWALIPVGITLAGLVFVARWMVRALRRRMGQRD